MKYCSNCGKECNDNDTICSNCGALVDNHMNNKTYMDIYHVNHGKRIKNKKVILWFLLGFILPYIGFLIAWIKYDSDRENAKAVMLGAIVSSVISWILPYVLSLFIGDNEEPNESDKKGEAIKNMINIYRCM